MPLKEASTMRSPELRAAMQLDPTIMGKLYERLKIEFANKMNGTPFRGGIAKLVYAQDVRRVLQARGFVFPEQAKVCSLMMCKGGVGKTTSTYFLAQRLSTYGARVLVIDADPQGNLTSAFNLDEFGLAIDEQTPVLVDVVTNKCSLVDAIIEVSPLLHLVPSTPFNCVLEGRIREHFKNPSLAFSRFIDGLKGNYDYIFFDCAPSLNLTNTAAVSASNLVILPVAPDRFSQMGLEQTLQEVRQIEADFKLKIETRIIFTKFDQREFTSLKYLTDVASKHEDRRFNTIIRTCSDVKNVITRNLDLFQLSKSNAREDYDQFAREFMGLTPKKLTRKPNRSQSAA